MAIQSIAFIDLPLRPRDQLRTRLDYKGISIGCVEKMQRTADAVTIYLEVEGKVQGR